MPTRRQLLAVTAGATAATAGCMSVLGDDSSPAAEESESETEPDEEAETVVLGELSVQNNHENDHELQVAVEADGDVLHLGNYNLEANGGEQTIEGDWEDDADSYRVHARLDDEEIQTADVTDGVAEGTECARALVRIDTSGELGIWNGADCE